MSIHAMNLVWQSFPRGGSEKLALLALADWCDDDGTSLHPSIATLARKISASPSQARRIVHGFVEEGLLEVIGNHNGGAKGDSRHYRLHLSRIATATANATPSIRATPSTHARDGLHPCALPLAPVQAKPPLTIKEPPNISPTSKSAPKPEKQKTKSIRQAETLKSFLDRCKADQAKAIAADDPIFSYAATVGLPKRAIELAWFRFKAAYLASRKRQSDWRAHFRNAVRGNWYKLWFIAQDGASGLTTAGLQVQREMDAPVMEGDL